MGNLPGGAEVMGTTLAPSQGSAAPATVIHQIVERGSDRLRAALPAHVTPQQLAEATAVLAYRTPDLLKCDPESLLTSLVLVGSLDLSLAPVANEAFLIPRWNSRAGCLECQFQPGYKGLEKLAIRTGSVLWMQPTEVCREDDEFFVENAPATRLVHRVDHRKPRGPVMAVYARAKMTDGDYLVEVMRADEVEAIHERTDGFRKARREGKAESGPWATDWLEMAKKTVVRRLCKRLPRATTDPTKARHWQALDQALEADNAEFREWTDQQQGLAAPPPPQNDSGYGRGQYANPEQTALYLERMTGFVDKANAQWLDRWQRPDGEFPAGFEAKTTRELCNRYQADGHLLKWAVETGRLDASIVPEDAKMRQIGRYTAIVYHRSRQDQKALALELDRYLRDLSVRKTEAVLKSNPELRGVADDPDNQADPDVDYPPESSTLGGGSAYPGRTREPGED